MNCYRVKWDTDVCADTPEEAARKAEQIMGRPSCRIFVVTDFADLMPKVIDLDNIPTNYSAS